MPKNKIRYAKSPGHNSVHTKFCQIPVIANLQIVIQNSKMDYANKVQVLPRTARLEILPHAQSIVKNELLYIFVMCSHTINKLMNKLFNSKTVLMQNV